MTLKYPFLTNMTKLQRKTAVLLLGHMMLVHFSSPFKKKKRYRQTLREERERKGESAHAVFKNNDQMPQNCTA